MRRGKAGKPRRSRATWRARPGCYSPAQMDFSVIGLNFLYAILGVVLMFGAYRVIDLLTPEVDFPAELRKGNVAVAIFIAAIFLSVAMVIAHSLN